MRGDLGHLHREGEPRGPQPDRTGVLGALEGDLLLELDGQADGEGERLQHLDALSPQLLEQMPPGLALAQGPESLDLEAGEGDLAAQTTQVMHNIGLALKAAGATYADIVKITTFVVGYKPELRPIIGKARSAFFEGIEPPASTLVGVSALAAPEWLIEIEAVAVVD